MTTASYTDEITGRTYEVSLTSPEHVEISERESGDLLRWAGAGDWDGNCIQDCAAILGGSQEAAERIYDGLSEALCEALADQPDPIVRCECGKATGERCGWAGPKSETVLVEYMPEHLRASHEAARNSGNFPHNGAIRIRCEAECAERLTHLWVDGEQTDQPDPWARIVG